MLALSRLNIPVRGGDPLKMKLTAALSLLLTLSFALDAAADTLPRDRLAPGVKIVRALRRLEHPPFRPQLVDGDLFVGSIRFERPPEDSLLETMEARGVEFLVTEGRRRSFGAIYPARVPFEQLGWLSELPEIIQVATDFLLPPIPPLDVTRPLTGAGTFSDVLEGVFGERPGEGMVIADFDHGIDPFHPGLFFADGGYFAWTDVNGDGKLQPGVDGVDLDGDGVIATTEVLSAFDGVMMNWYAEPHLDNDDGLYDPRVDWLYLDQNSTGVREWGAAAGATDDTAAFGEPVFVVDDVNGNGVVGLEEKLVLLRTSKVRAVRVGDVIYERGVNLSALDPDQFQGTWEADKSGHGTGVTGILVANSPRRSRFVGIAPYAEVILVDSSTGAGNPFGYMERMLWAKDQGAHLFLHEYSSWGSDHMDGTSNYDQALDEMTLNEGVPQVCPAGNLAESGKHGQFVATPGTTVTRIELPAEYPGRPGYGFEVPYLYITLYFEGDPGDVDLALGIPGLAAPVPLPKDVWDPAQLAGDVYGGAWGSKSPGGFAMITVVVMTEDQSPLPAGEWAIHLDNQSDGALSVHGFLNDPLTGWGRGPTWLDGLSTSTTICSPSTATEALSVAAYAGVHDGAEGQGNLRGYSSRGPRMDGAVKPGLAAPDDPYTTLPAMQMPYGYDIIHGGYTVFGGTSGAGPHVAGAMALLMQAADGLSATQVVQRMYSGAIQTPDMGPLPNKDWGYGKLDVHAAAMGAAAAANALPVAVGSASMGQDRDYQVVLTGAESMDPDGDPLTYRWDTNYDGVWDTAQGDSSDTILDMDGPAAGIAKLRVYDDKGAFSEVLVGWEALAARAEDIGGVEPGPVGDIVGVGDTLGPAADTIGDVNVNVNGNGDVNGNGGGCAMRVAPAGAWWMLMLLGLAWGRWLLCRVPSGLRPPPLPL